MNSVISMQSPLRSERGVALVLIIFGIAVVVGLIAGIFVAAVLEHRTGQGFRPGEQAFNAAEYGLTQSLAQWNRSDWNVLAVNGSSPVSGTTPQGTGTYAGAVRRLSSNVFLLDVTGTSRRGAARQRLGAYVKLRTATVDIRAALTTRGASRIGGSARIDGTDQVPAGWANCPATQPSEAGIRVPDASELEFIGGCFDMSCVTGTPKVEEDPAIADSTFFEYGDADWAALTAMADKTLPGGNYTQIGPRLTGGGECDVADPLNWGAPLTPTSPCGDYFPIVYVNGDMTMNNGVGQGLLLVEGDLNSQGNVQFFGIVIVRGRFKTGGSGNHFTGGVMAANVVLDQNTMLGNAEVQYSSCAMLRAQQSAGVGAPLRTRGWVQLF